MAAGIAAARATHHGARGIIQAWLWLTAALVFAMVIVGGATRLTGSGLSITEWRPIMGIIPPLSDEAWQAAFALYKEIPQYKLVNKGMSLDAFKAIFWWEWGHRALGRAIGIVFALPLAWFWWTGRIDRVLGLKLLGILALGGLQAVAGWYMVASGLVELVSVSQYRLAVHLSIAFVILGALVWVALDLARDGRQGSRDGGGARAAWIFAASLTALLLVQVIAGAFVAGMKAGLLYNTWPLMEGRLVPAGLFAKSPWWVNLGENMLTVQFHHRLLAYTLLVASWGHAVLEMRRDGTSRIALSALFLALALTAQAAFGIWTLLAGVPLSLGLVHQGFAAVVFALAVWHLHRARAAS
ncbi:MAG TPA: COX15/CtaA family protein [Hyphomicrobiaceae bacterium]|nr:COX15/CtaA family protein [Hyphomicrobiaceae bacterium]